jgi:hypothetical protein
MLEQTTYVGKRLFDRASLPVRCLAEVARLLEERLFSVEERGDTPRVSQLRERFLARPHRREPTRALLTGACLPREEFVKGQGPGCDLGF